MIKSKVSLAVLTALTTCALSTTAAAQTQPGEDNVELIQVRGIQGSLRQAAFQKQTSDVIQDSIVAEDIGKFPDQNVAESLQRITGVSISRVNGEGSQISVRSFGPEFNVVKLNDRTLATTTGSRSFDFQVLPSQLISGADVMKSPTADLSAGSIGAYVNIKTAKPLKQPGFHASATAKTNYHSLVKDATPELAGIISNTFDDDTWGVLVGVSFKENANRIDAYRTSHWNQYAGNGSGYGFPMDAADVLGEDGNPTTLAGSRGPGRSIFNMIDEDRERFGANVAVQWAPNDSFESTFDGLYTRLDREYLGSGLQVPNQTPRYTRAVISDEGTLLEATIADTDLEMNVVYGLQESTTTAFGYNGVYTGDRLVLEFDASYSKAETSFEGDDTTALHYTMFDADGVRQPSEILIDYHNDIPSLSTTGALDVTDISKVRAAWQRYAAEEAEDTVKEVKLDALYDIDAGPLVSVKAGAAYTKRNIAFSRFGTEFDPTSGGETWNGAGMWIGDGSTWGDNPATGALPASVLELSANNFMDGTGSGFPRQWVQIANHKAYREATQAYLEQAVANGDGWRGDIVNAGWDTVYPSPGGSYANDETMIALYSRFNFEGELGDYTWRGNLGARYVDIDNTARGTASTIDMLMINQESSNLPESVDNTATTSAKSSTVDTSESHFLPSANFMLNFENGYIVRLAAAQTITRPSLADAGVNVQETAGVDSPTVTISGGNPYLKSYEVNQLDASVEYYADNGNAYSLAFFYKDISNFISTITTVGPWEGNISPELAAAYANLGQTVTYNSTRKENRDGGSVTGLEVGVLHNFDFLPGFGVQANYTYADSKDDSALPINLPSVVEPGSGLEGFAKNSYNLIAFYDKDAFQARVAYNWRDSFLSSRSGDGIQPEYNDAYGQLDASASYDINETFTVSLEAVNLTNETRLQYYGQRDRVSLVEMTGTRYYLGVRATF